MIGAKEKIDHAPLANQDPNHVGGVLLDPKNIKMRIQNDGEQTSPVRFPKFPLLEIQDFDGVRFEILNITPAQLPQLLGLTG